MQFKRTPKARIKYLKQCRARDNLARKLHSEGLTQAQAFAEANRLMKKRPR